MEKGKLIKFIVGSTVFAAGAAALAASKLIGNDAPARHDASSKHEAAPEELEPSPEIQDDVHEEAINDITEEPVDVKTIFTTEEDEKYVDEYAPEPAEVQPTEVQTVEEPVIAVEPDHEVQEEEQAYAPAEPVEQEEEQAYAPAEPAEQKEEQPPANLEQYIELNPKERESLDVVKDGFAAEGVKTDVSFVENTMFFDFMMTDVEDEETKEILKPDLQAFLDDQTESYTGIVKQMEENTGFSDIKMIVIFMDANEEEIVSGHYDESGRTM